MVMLGAVMSPWGAETWIFIYEKSLGQISGHELCVVEVDSHDIRLYFFEWVEVRRRGSKRISLDCFREKERLFELDFYSTSQRDEKKGLIFDMMLRLRQVYKHIKYCG